MERSLQGTLEGGTLTTSHNSIFMDPAAARRDFLVPSVTKIHNKN